MAFPVTRKTLIQRLAHGGAQEDWQDFLRDYWGAVCRFAQNVGHLSFDDSEDVASEVFETILKAQLLQRWTESRTAKLRTLICSVVRNVLSNRLRTLQGRARVVQEHAGRLDRYQLEESQTAEDAPQEQIDAFCTAWSESLIKTAADDLLRDYNSTNRSDYFRVLYGRICEGLSMAEIAEALRIPVSSADNHYRHARARLGERLEELVRSHVHRYCPLEDANEEFAREWNCLKDTLQQLGGLESALRTVYTTD
jgi:RNA polymerase sigma factor (sigma-70 family)